MCVCTRVYVYGHAGYMTISDIAVLLNNVKTKRQDDARGKSRCIVLLFCEFFCMFYIHLYGTNNESKHLGILEKANKI